MRFLIDLLYLLAALLIAPVALYRMLRHNRYRAGWPQKLGSIQRRNSEKECIWLHAVSMGEVNAAKTVLERLSAQFSDHEILVTTTTDTGYARATTIFAEKYTVSYFPFDFSWLMNRAFRNIRPSLCLLMELEVWPNLVRIAKKRGVPVVVVNGRISDHSYKTYRKVRPLVKFMFQKVSLALAQTEEYAQRFTHLGCPKVIVSGSLKYDTAQTKEVPGTDTLAQQLGLKAPSESEPIINNQSSIINPKLWVCGGTGTNEEALLLDVYEQLKKDDQFKDLTLAIVPRKPERFEEVAQLIRARGHDLIRYSEIKQASNKIINNQSSIINPQDASVILGDTMGDLRKFYSLADIIFVGRSLVPMGGSDMMEAAALGKCTIFGPHTFNFKQTVKALLKAEGAITAKDKQHLLKIMKKCLSNPAFASQTAKNGREVIIANQGATQKTIDQIKTLLPAH